MSTTPEINQHWPEQGGIFIGSRLIDGQVHHVVIPGGIEHDAKDIKFADVESSIPAEINGRSDWRAPDQEDLMLAFINSREHFEREGMASYYWSRTVDDDNWAWAVDFEYGSASNHLPGQRVPCSSRPQFSRFSDLTLCGRSPPRHGTPH